MIEKSHPFYDDLIRLKAEGKPAQAILRAAKKAGYDIKIAELKAFYEQFQPVTKAHKEQALAIPVIDTDEIFSRYDINEPTTPDEIMGATQELAARAMLLQQAILIGKLEAHARGECLYPEEDLKGIQAIGQSYQQLWGYPLRVSSSAALQTLQSQGFTVEGHEIDTDLFELELKSAGLDEIEGIEGSD